VLDVHGAHGYLIHEFLSPSANRRDDEYGGSEINCMRLCIEVVEAVRAHWPARKPAILRLSVEDKRQLGPEQSVALARIVKDKGVDVIDCSSGGMTVRRDQRGGPSATATRSVRDQNQGGGGLMDHGRRPDVHAGPGGDDPTERARPT